MSWSRSPALLVATAFAAFGTAWVIVGTLWDWLAGQDWQDWMAIELAKGQAFVLMSSVLIYVIVRTQWTRRTALEGQMRAREAMHRRLFEKHSACQIVLDPIAQTILDANPAAADYFGMSLDALKGRWLGDINGRSAAEIGAMLGRIASGEISVVEDRVLIPESPPKHVEIFPAAVDVDGRTVIYSVFHDCTDRKLAECEIARGNRALKALAAGNRAVAQSNTATALFSHICRSLVEHAGYAVASIGRAEYGTGLPIETEICFGDADGVLEGFRESWSNDHADGRGPSGRAVRSGRAECQSLQDRNGAGPAWPDGAVVDGFEALLAVPIFADDRVKYVLRILVREQDGFGEEEIRLLEALGEDLSRALHVHESLNRFDAVSAEKADAVGRLKTIIYEVVEAFGSAVDKLDPYTAGHEARVSDLAVRIAKRMGLAPDRIEGLMLGALIHDIGKVGVPLQILTKPGKLTTEEFALVKSHVEIGHEVMKNIHFPWPINRIIREHHERLDGSGYPFGLEGDEICLEAQIIAVADVVESMTSHRPYRPALTAEAAVAELQRGKGSRYNVAAVEACLREMPFKLEPEAGAVPRQPVLNPGHLHS